MLQPITHASKNEHKIYSSNVRRHTHVTQINELQKSKQEIVCNQFTYWRDERKEAATTTKKNTTHIFMNCCFYLLLQLWVTLAQLPFHYFTAHTYKQYFQWNIQIFFVCNQVIRMNTACIVIPIVNEYERKQYMGGVPAYRVLLIIHLHSIRYWFWIGVPYDYSTIPEVTNWPQK